MRDNEKTLKILPSFASSEITQFIISASFLSLKKFNQNVAKKLEISPLVYDTCWKGVRAMK